MTDFCERWLDLLCLVNAFWSQENLFPEVFFLNLISSISKLSLCIYQQQ